MTSLRDISGGEIRDPAAHFLMSRYNHSLTYHNPMRRRWAEDYNLWRGWWTGPHEAFRNNVGLPLIFSTIQTDVARKANISFGAYPWCQFVGGGPEDSEKARRVEALVNQQLRASRTYQKAIDMYTQADLYGTAVCQVGWRLDTEPFRRRVEIEGSKGQKFERTELEDRTTFDGPDWSVIDPLDFFPQPGTHTLEDMDWVIVRYYMELDEIRARFGDAKADKIVGTQLFTGDDRINAGGETAERAMASPMTLQQSKLSDKYSRPIEILEMWTQTAPFGFDLEDGVPRRVISIANRAIELRNEPTPYEGVLLPFHSMVSFRDPHNFYGIGKAEIAKKMQITANRFMNQKLDALDAFIDPFFIYDRNMGIDPRDLYMRAGRVFGVDGNPKDAVMPVFPDMRGMQAALGEIEQLWKWIQQGTGIVEDTAGGGPGAGGRETARAFLGRQEAVNTRLMLENRLSEEMWFQPLCMSYHLLNGQLLEFPQAVRVAGAHALIDPITAVPYREEVSLEDVIGIDYDIIPAGGSNTLGKAQQQQNMMMLLQAASANPIAMQMVNWAEFMRSLFKASEMPNLETLLTPSEEQQEAFARAQNFEAGPPDSGGGGGGLPFPSPQAGSTGSLLGLPGAEMQGFADSSQTTGQI